MEPPLDLDSDDTANPGHAPTNPVALEYEARRCDVCQRKYPSFGFDRPFAKKDQPVVWACSEHRATARMLTGGQAGHEKREPARLL
jgi:hypothetical protein